MNGPDCDARLELDMPDGSRVEYACTLPLAHGGDFHIHHNTRTGQEIVRWSVEP